MWYFCIFVSVVFVFLCVFRFPGVKSVVFLLWVHGISSSLRASQIRWAS